MKRVTIKDYNEISDIINKIIKGKSNKLTTCSELAKDFRLKKIYLGQGIAYKLPLTKILEEAENVAPGFKNSIYYRFTGDLATPEIIKDCTFAARNEQKEYRQKKQKVNFPKKNNDNKDDKKYMLKLFTDKELADELRNRGYEVKAKKYIIEEV